ncbi:MAG: T9SS type A sorting domain-containing protein [Bacteroidales bacterium]|jgi:hypothetical protein
MNTNIKYCYFKQLTFFTVFIFLQNISFSQCPSGYHSTGIERVTNGNFESGNSGFTSQYTWVANQDGVQNELQPEGYYSVWTNSNDLHASWSSCKGYPSDSGKYMIVNGATVAGVEIWRQSIPVTQNTKYYFTAWINSVCPTNPARLQFSADSVLLGSIFTASSTTCEWQQFYATWDSGSNTNANISIVNQNTIATGNDFGLDDISFIPCELDPLPIQIGSFGLELSKEGYVIINWNTFTESNNDYFTVEKSKDAIAFEPVATVEGAGNSIENINYSSIDQEPYQGISYYRLSQTDYDGKKTIVIMKPVKNDISNLRVLTNDNTNSITIYSNYCNINIMLYDIQGNLVLNTKLDSKMFEISNLTHGMYILKLSNDKINDTRKIIIK